MIPDGLSNDVAKIICLSYQGGEVTDAQLAKIVEKGKITTRDAELIKSCIIN